MTTNGDQTICETDNVQLTASGATSYVWSPATGLDNPNIANPMASPSTTTTYQVIGTTGDGCADTTSLTVTVNPLPVLTVSADTAYCEGESRQLIASGATNYVWSPATGLSDPNIANPIASPTTTTTYTVTGTNGIGCSATATTTITVNPHPTVTTNGDHFSCAGEDVQLEAFGATTYEWTPITDLNNANIANPVASPSSTTTYTVIGTDANGCTDNATSTITVQPLPTVVTNNDTTICEGVSVQLNASGATTYSWSPSAGLDDPNVANPTATPTTTTTYTVTGTTAGCSNTAQVTITVNPLPSISTNGDQSFCQGDDAQLLASGSSVSYVWSPSAGLDNPNIANPLASPTTTTTYVVTGTDANGCTNSDSLTVLVNPMLTITPSKNPEICIGDSVQIGATGGINYSWSPSTGLSNTTISDPIAFPSTTTEYVVTAQDGNGCTARDTVTVTVHDLPTAQAGNDTTICFGTSTPLSATGGVSYAWTPSATLDNPAVSNPTASPSTSTKYLVEVTDANGCKDTDSMMVNIQALPSITTNGDQTICEGDSVTLTASGATSYTWKPSATLSADNGTSVQAFPTTNTTYTVIGTDGLGCVDSTTVTVNVNPKPAFNITATKDTICTGISAILIASDPNLTYTWSPSTGLSATTGQSVSATPSTSTTYIVTGTDANGCSDTSSIFIYVEPEPNMTISPDPTICEGDTITLVGACQPLDTYEWTPATGLATPMDSLTLAYPTTTTTYTLTATSPAGCQASESVTVTVNPLPNVTVTPSDSICLGDSKQLVATGGGTYKWTPSTGLSADNIANPVASPTTTTTYTVVVTTGNGCEDSASTTITVDPVLSSATASRDTICAGDTVTLSALGTNVSNYAWSPAGEVMSPNSATTLARPTTSTTFVVSGTNATGCTNTDSVHVEVLPIPNLSVTSDTILCMDDSAVLVATGGTDYTWSPATGLNTTTGDTVIATPSTTTTYTVVTDNAGGCTDTAQVTVTVNGLPTITASNDATICLGDEATLTAQGGLMYAWTPTTDLNVSDSDTVLASPSNTTTYVVTGMDANGCENSDSVTVNVNPLPTVTATAPAGMICAGDSVQLTAQGTGALIANPYTWTPASSLNVSDKDTVTAKPSSTTNYIVSVTDINGCMGYDSVEVEVFSNPNIAVSNDTTICFGDTIQLVAQGGTSYLWTGDGVVSPNSDVTTIIPTTGGTYTVEITDTNGCTNTASVEVTLRTIPTGTAMFDQDTLCYGETATLSLSMDSGFFPNTNGSFTFDNGQSFSGINAIDFSQDTTLVVRFRDNFGCLSTPADTVNLKVLDSLSMDLTVITTPDCSTPGEFTANNFQGGTGSYWVALDDGNFFEVSDTTYSGLLPGLYPVTLKDSYGCYIEETANLLQAFNFDSVLVDPTCYGDANGSITIANFEGGVAPYEFSLNDSTSFGPDSVFNNLSAGNHTIYAKDASGCMVTLNLKLDQPDSLQVLVLDEQHINCLGVDAGDLTIEVKGGIAPYQVDLLGNSYNSDSTFSFDNLPAFSDTLVAMDNLGCTVELPVEITAPEAIEVFITQTTLAEDCKEANGTAVIDSVKNGSGLYLFSLDNGVNYDSQTDIETQMDSLASGKYTLLVQDEVSGCTDTASFSIQNKDGLLIDSVKVTVKAPSCLEVDGQVQLSNLIGNAPYTFALKQDSTMIIDFQADSLLAGSVNGDTVYGGNYIAIVKDVKDCEYTFDAVVPNTIPFEVTNTVAPASCGADNGYIALNISGGKMDYTITLKSEMDSLTHVIATDSIMVDSLTTGVYAMTITDASDEACVIQDTLTVGDLTANALLNITDVTCRDSADGMIEIIRLQNANVVEFGYRFNLNDSTQLGTDSLYTGLSGGNNVLWIEQTRLSDSTSCIYPDRELMYNGITQDSIWTDSIYVWEPDTINAEILGLPSKVEVPDGIVFAHTITGGNGIFEMALDDSTNFFSYEQGIDTLINRFTEVPRGQHIVYVRDQKGCINRFGVEVGTKFYVPNTFSPNGDGVNDVFFIHSLPEGSRFRVYDRWGVRVYQHDSYDNTWDADGVDDGVYYYDLETKIGDFNGWIEIIR